ncbi:MAG: hypothetical protein PHH37_14470 [Paludibacter sp.]|nr:hypothetical protein [Paludibacter sp.]
MEETLEQKKRRLFGKQYLTKYIDVVKKITTQQENNEIRLLSITETDKLIVKENTLKLIFSTKILFNNKLDLKKIILEKVNTNDKIYLFTSLSQHCGAVVLESITEFNFNFNFGDDPSGIISLLSFKVDKKILLDFYEEEGIKYIEIEYYH